MYLQYISLSLSITIPQVQLGWRWENTESQVPGIKWWRRRAKATHQHKLTCQRKLYKRQISLTVHMLDWCMEHSSSRIRCTLSPYQKSSFASVPSFFLLPFSRGRWWLSPRFRPDASSNCWRQSSSCHKAWRREQRLSQAWAWHIECFKQDQQFKACFPDTSRQVTRNGSTFLLMEQPVILRANLYG